MCKVARFSAIVVVWMILSLIPQVPGEKKYSEAWMEAHRDEMS